MRGVFQGKQRVKAVHFKLPSKAGPCQELEDLLNERRANVLQVLYSVDDGEKWVLVIYEET